MESWGLWSPSPDHHVLSDLEWSCRFDWLKFNICFIGQKSRQSYLVSQHISCRIPPLPFILELTVLLHCLHGFFFFFLLPVVSSNYPLHTQFCPLLTMENGNSGTIIIQSIIRKPAWCSGLSVKLGSGRSMSESPLNFSDPGQPHCLRLTYLIGLMLWE